nr:MAG TPA: hypothetical protein [Caudoviricetes sp.]
MASATFFRSVSVVRYSVILFILSFHFANDGINIMRAFDKILLNPAFCGHGWCSDTKPAGLHWATLVIRHGVLVQCDAVTVKFILHHFAGQMGMRSAEVDKEHMVVCSSSYHIISHVDKFLSHSIGICNYLSLVCMEANGQRFFSRNRLTCDDVHKRATLGLREDGTVDFLRQFRLAENHAATGASQGLMGRGCDDVGISKRRRMQASRNKSCYMGHIHHHQWPIMPFGFIRIKDFGKCDIVQNSAIRRCPNHDHLGFMQEQLPPKVIVVNIAIVIYAVMHKIEQLTADVECCSMAQMTACRQIHCKDGIAFIKHGHVCCKICIGTAVWLDIDMIVCLEHLLPFPLAVGFKFINDIASAIVSLAGKSFCVFVCQATANCRHYIVAYKILTGNQFDIIGLARLFQFDEIKCVHSFLASSSAISRLIYHLALRTSSMPFLASKRQRYLMAFAVHTASIPFLPTVAALIASIHSMPP